ncbi:uncharacterized protein LOC131846759 [Achroia grisella]|uniref:uncharacterized protein LOC131846759 n=1 Tax=Achroia grisella TaxID=688607 RepID=UPI0027D33008|nr:uncharacterized protein LOC131846759 [Achroia grisella]
MPLAVTFGIIVVKELKLKNGVLHGLDSMYRRSVATGIRVKGENIRKTDVIIGFSNLKAVYNYDAVLTTGVPPLNGQLILSADELTSLMSIKLVKDSETVDINFEFMQQMKPESLALEGPANTMIANFKHLLELHIIAIMSNSMIYQIKLLSSLTKCQPYFVAHIDPEDLKYRNSIKEAYENETLQDESNRLIIFKNNEDNKSNEISKEDLKETSDTGSVVENVTESLSENEEDLTTENGEDSSSENSDDETKVVTSNADFILNKQDSIQNGVAS